MEIHWSRIKKAQELLAENKIIALMIMNHDDYRYFFGGDRTQPRAIIPVIGEPVFFAFEAEKEELSQKLNEKMQIFTFKKVQEQMSGIREVFRNLLSEPTINDLLQVSHSLEQKEKIKVGMQLLFATPYFLVELFEKLNPKLKIVSSDPVMDQLRMVKDESEFNLLTKAQAIAAKGMDRVIELLQPGVTEHELATEALYTMMKQGSVGTSTPIHINSGVRSNWIHGTFSKRSIEKGDLVVVNLTPMFEGYCANLARTFVVGKATDSQLKLLETYHQIVLATQEKLLPGTTSKELDAIGEKIAIEQNLAEFHINGISHGIGLRFEETPASTIIPVHRRVKLIENMAVTIGHTILAVPEIGGVRMEDIYRVTLEGGKILHPYPLDRWEIS